MLMLFSFLKSEAFHLPVAASLMSTQRLTVEERERPSFHNAISSDRLKRFTDSLPAEAKTWRRRSIAILFLLLLSVLFFFAHQVSRSLSFIDIYIYIYIYTSSTSVIDMYARIFEFRIVGPDRKRIRR